MKRLTKYNYCDDTLYLDTKEQIVAFNHSLYKKLKTYEDIEEELGIDLITLNKLRSANKIYVKFYNEIQEWNKIKIDLRYCKIWYGYISGKGYCLSQPLSNYGKGFALTKEELENDK